MAKKVCDKCKELNNTSAAVCCSCGESLKDAKIIGKVEPDNTEIIKRCPKCGDTVKPEDRNCRNCGEFIARASSTYSFKEATSSNYYYRGPGSTEDAVSMGMWMLILIGLGIPILNIILLIGLAFGASNESLKNFGKAALALGGIAIVLMLLLRGCSI